MTHPAPPFPSSLRTDFRQWLIDDAPVNAAVLHALEVGALSALGQRLAGHDDVEVRALGHFALKIAETRTRLALEAGPDSLDAKATTAVAEALQYVFAGGPKPIVALDELHASVYALDHYLNRAGIRGPGLRRVVARGEV